MRLTIDGIECRRAVPGRRIGRQAIVVLSVDRILQAPGIDTGRYGRTVGEEVAGNQVRFGTGYIDVVRRGGHLARGILVVVVHGRSRIVGTVDGHRGLVGEVVTESGALLLGLGHVHPGLPEFEFVDIGSPAIIGGNAQGVVPLVEIDIRQHHAHRRTVPVLGRLGHREDYRGIEPRLHGDGANEHAGIVGAKLIGSRLLDINIFKHDFRPAIVIAHVGVSRIAVDIFDLHRRGEPGILGLQNQQRLLSIQAAGCQQGKTQTCNFLVHISHSSLRKTIESLPVQKALIGISPGQRSRKWTVTKRVCALKRVFHVGNIPGFHIL